MPDKPIRIRRLRAKGFRLQDQSPDGRPVVYVGRPTEWGNRWFIVNQGRFGWLVQGYGRNWYPSSQRVAQRFAVWLFRQWMKGFGKYCLDLDALRGKHLACWCPLSAPCHADVLLELANAGEGDIDG